MKLKKHKQSNFLIINSIYKQTYKKQVILKNKEIKFFNNFNGLKNRFIFFKIEQISINIKKILKIMFEFNTYHKALCFFGFNDSFSRLLFKTKNCNLPVNFWLFGLFDNKKFVCNNFSLKKSTVLDINTLSKIKKKYDLFVILGNNLKNKMLNECLRVKSLSGLDIPVIFLNEFIKLPYQIQYSVLGNFSNFCLIERLLFLSLYKQKKYNYF